MKALLIFVIISMSQISFASLCVRDVYYETNGPHWLRTICVGDRVMLAEEVNGSEIPQSFEVVSVFEDETLKISKDAIVHYVKAPEIISFDDDHGFHKKGDDVYLPGFNSIFQYQYILSNNMVYYINSERVVLQPGPVYNMELGCENKVCVDSQFFYRSDEFVGEVIIKRVFDSYSLVQPIIGEHEAFFVRSFDLIKISGYDYLTPLKENFVHDLKTSINKRAFYLKPHHTLRIVSEGICVREILTEEGWKYLDTDRIKNTTEEDLAMRFNDCLLFLEVNL